MCTYNGAKFLREQIETILTQTYPLYELLVFDDASTDDTVKILKEYVLNNPLLTIHENDTNIGFAANFKKALLAAKGDVIAPADQDDVWMKNKIERLLSRWNDKSLMTYCDSVRFQDSIPAKPVSNPLSRRFEGINPRKIFLFNTISGHAMLIKKELLNIASPIPDNIFYDWWFAVVAAYNGGIVYVDETLVLQRVHAGNVSISEGFDHSKKSHQHFYKQMVIKHLNAFKNAVNIPVADKKFVETFADLLQKSFDENFCLPLFTFLIRHRNQLFFYKKRKIKLLSHLKHAYRLSSTYN